MDSIEIRKKFVDFYNELGYQTLSRASMLHPSTPMSFVMSAGLAQIETSLAQAENREGDQFVLVQECFRHFDLDRVGTDDIHLSFFEMPGAFVFGSNGKTRTVQRMWDLATSVLGIDKNRIWVSYFSGGEVLGSRLSADHETQQAWVRLGLPPARIVALGPEDNYWIQGTGIDGRMAPRKCGPNTELFYDKGAARACGPDCRPGCKCGRFVEFSNSLFIHNRLGEQNKRIHPISEPFTETVIGTERVAMILQDTRSVFEIKGYRSLMCRIESFVQAEDVPERLWMSSQRVIADHLKALYFLVADGAPEPGKNGRERIVKLLIRGIVTRQRILQIASDRFLPTVLRAISETPDAEVEARVQAYFSIESRRFLKTVQRASRHLERLLQHNAGHTLSGEQIVELEKNWGLPHLLAAETLRKKGLPFPEAGYWEALEVWKRKVHH